jgi:hypothetical protein
VQIFGPEGRDEDVLTIAEAIEAQMGGFQRPPEDALKALPTMVRPKPARKPAKQVKARPEKPARPVKAESPGPARKAKPPKPVKDGKK